MSIEWQRTKVFLNKNKKINTKLVTILNIIIRNFALIHIFLKQDNKVPHEFVGEVLRRIQ